MKERIGVLVTDGLRFPRMGNEISFSHTTLPSELVEDLRRQNPWWEGRALPLLPPHHRHLVRQIQRRLEWKLAPVVVVRGPRQIGKTTAQLHLIEDLLKSGVRGPADSPRPI